MVAWSHGFASLFHGTMVPCFALFLWYYGFSITIIHLFYLISIFLAPGVDDMFYFYFISAML